MREFQAKLLEVTKVNSDDNSGEYNLVLMYNMLQY
jgi:hypothetical protein